MDRDTLKYFDIGRLGSRGIDTSTLETVDMSTEGMGGVSESDLDSQLPTYPSRPVTFIDIPEPKNFTAKFQYNFFTPDERTSANSTSFLVDLGITTAEEIRTLAQRSRFPRYVSLKWSMEDFNDFEPGDWRYNVNTSYNLADKGIESSDIMDEEAISNAFFSAAAMQDTGTDIYFYSLAAAASRLFGIDFDSTSGNTVGNEVADIIGSTSLVDSSGKKLLVETLSNLQSQGVTFSSSDVRTSIDSFMWTPVRNLKFNFNLNNLIISSLLRSSSENHLSLFEDEIRAALPAAREIQSRAIVNSTPGSIDISGEYDFEIAPIAMTAIDVSDSGIENLNESTVLVGYVIEKQEILTDGSLVKRDSIFISNNNITELHDPFVRYGGAYIYTVKAVAIARFEAIRGDPDSSNSDQVVIADVLIKSKGVSLTANCFESVPPPPPNNLRFHYDFGQESLVVFWDFPVNPQRDIKRFQIFRRERVSEPFSLLKEYDFDNSESRSSTLENVPSSLIETMPYASTYFIDSEFKKGNKYIYSICSIDARGLTSNYSSQFMVEFDTFKQRIKSTTVSSEEAPKSYPNLYLTQDLFVDTMKDSDHSKINLYFDPEYLDVLRNVSLDSGLTTEESLSLLSLNGSSGNPDYRLQIINTDFQQGEIVDIYIGNSLSESYFSYSEPSEIELSALGGLSGLIEI